MIIQNVIDIILEETNNSREFYLTGGCYKFASILKSIVGGEIRWLNQEQHAILSLNNKLYDVTGNVTSKYINSESISEDELKSRYKIYNSLLK